MCIYDRYIYLFLHLILTSYTKYRKKHTDMRKNDNKVKIQEWKYTTEHEYTCMKNVNRTYHRTGAK